MKKVLAFDFGASSGRAMLGTYDNGKITLEEIHRFSNDPVMINDGFHWDILRLFHEIKQGILKCVNSGNGDISAIGIDTWGVDYGYINKNGSLMSNPYHYRDVRTSKVIDKTCKDLGKEFIFENTGIQFMFFNTLFQLISEKESGDNTSDNAKAMLFMPDLMNYLLTGNMVTERTIASTSQIYNPKKGDWAYELIEKAGINKDILTNIVDPGYVVGELRDEICEELGINKIPVIAVASHDTASAVASVPAVDEKDFIYISSGTWSLMGIESDEPIIDEKSLELNFTNEIGYGNKVRFLKNIMGLWIIQECRRQWAREGEQISFAELEKMALESKPFVSYINPDDELFAPPGNMPKRIREYCAKTNQPVPETKGEIMMCVYQSLALKYKSVAEGLEKIKGKELPVIHIVGGGIQDRTLCQLTADATGKKIVAGPVEATAIGNVSVQMISLGEIDTLENARKVISNSFEQKIYEPKTNSAWEDAYDKYKELLK